MMEPHAHDRALPTHGGELPPWEVADLPTPPPVSFGSKLRIAGPGAILLAISIGAGEWVLGPAIAVRYGPGLLGIVTLGIILQVFFNLEAIRYTLYTGEPIYGGFLRLKPGPRFWTPFYIALVFLQQGWPALAASASVTLIASFKGRLPIEADASLLHWVVALLFLACLLLLSFGGTVERMLEVLSACMVGLVMVFLLVVNLLFVPWSIWAETLRGFFQMSSVGGTLDWALLGALAATAGAGGLPNLTITNWMRDKGYGMGAQTGAIPSAFGGTRVRVSPFGKVFEATSANLERWKAWMRYVHFDQVWLWAGGAFLGMFLNVNLALAVIPRGTEMSGMAIGVYQAKYMAESLWSGFWVLALLNGFWIFFSTHLGNTDMVARTVTDVLWLGSPPVRHWGQGRIQVVYYSIIGLYTLIGLSLVRLATPLTLLKIIANLGGLVMVIGGIQIFLVNRKFLPRPLQAPWWRQLGLLACVLFYGFFVGRVLLFGLTRLGG